MSSKQNFGRKKKSKFKGNRYTKSSKVTETLKSSSLRYQKISKTSNETSKKDDDNYFLFVYFKILKDLISSLTCSVCNAQKLSLSNKLDLRMGFTNKLLIKCFFCDWSNEFYTYPTCSCPQDAPIRGFSSLNGYVAAINHGKCIDVYVMTKYCRQCQIWNRKKGSEEHQNWLSKHNCPINHESSSGAMESTGAVEIFQRSVLKNNLIYNEYLGDGDTSSYKEVFAYNVYKDYGINPIKLECVGHVQKKCGNRLRNLRKKFKGTKNSLPGRGKLRNKTINSMQNFYGLAIRQNLNNLYSMKKAVLAIVWHCCETDKGDKVRHQFCPPGLSSWCRYKKDLVNGTNNYKKNINLPSWSFQILFPTFLELSSDKLLSKCLHGQTQNANEGFNNIVWSRCPKNTFVTKDVLEIGINSAIIYFNDGATGVNNIMAEFAINGCRFMQKANISLNKLTIQWSVNKSNEKTKKRRKQLRTKKKGLPDNANSKDVAEAYVSGGF